MAKAGGSDSFLLFSCSIFHKVYDMTHCTSFSETFEKQKACDWKLAHSNPFTSCENLDRDTE